MKKPKALPDYDSLPICPFILANNVAYHPYKGEEWSEGIVDPKDAARIEALRQKMTPEDVARFEAEVEDRCRKAHACGAAYWVKIVRAKGQRGVNQLYPYISHWLVAFLTRPKDTPAETKQTA